MISKVERDMLLALKRLGKRNGMFPPAMMSLKDQFNDMDDGTFTQHLSTLREHGYLRIAAGKSRGLFITPSGLELAEKHENAKPEDSSNLCVSA